MEKIFKTGNMHVHCHRHKHKSPTPFWVAAGYVRTWQMTRDIISQYVHWFARVPAPSMVERSFTINLAI